MGKNMLLTFKSDIDNEESGKDTIEFMTTADFVKKKLRFEANFWRKKTIFGDRKRTF